MGTGLGLPSVSRHASTDRECAAALPHVWGCSVFTAAIVLNSFQIYTTDTHVWAGFAADLLKLMH